MNLVRAKSRYNSLDVRDNRLFAIENITFLCNGFSVVFVDLLNNRKNIAVYKDRAAFDEEWELCFDVMDKEEYREFDEVAIDKKLNEKSEFLTNFAEKSYGR